MKERWLSLDQASKLSRWHPHHCERQARAGKITRRLGPKGRNGKPIPEYALSSLPAAAQQRYWRAAGVIPGSNLRQPGRKAGPPNPTTEVAMEPRAQRSLFHEPVEVTAEERAALPPRAAQQAEARLKMISPLLEFQRRRNGHRPTFQLADGRQVSSLEALAGYLAAQHQISRGTLFRWLKRYKTQGGFAALANRGREDRGSSRLFREHAPARALLETKYLKERLSMKLAHQALEREWRRLDAKGQPAPSYTTVRNYLNRLPQPLAVLARDGDEEFTARCQPYLLTDFRKLKVNEIWVSDHGVHDVWVQNDCFTSLQRGAALRVWLTAIMDMRSRKVVGATWCATPSSHTISSALRLGITACGLPQTFYIDNGKDYQKVGKIGLSPECSGVLAVLGIRPQFCLPRHPQSKLIESWFATVRKRFDALWRPFYCGASPTERPEDCAAALKRHEHFLKGKRESSPLPPASEFIALAREWVARYNAEHPHSGRAMNGRTPQEVYAALLPESHTRPLENPHALDCLFWERQKRKVREGGSVELYSELYEPADEASAAALFLEIEREILVACDPTNLGEALALSLDGHFLGRLRAQRLIARGPVSHEDVKASMRLRARIRRACKDYVAWVSRGQETELEHLRRSAGLPQTLAARALPAASQKLVAAASQRVARPDFVEDVVADLMEEE
ncbi:MAG: hypothetical protein ACRD2R_01470 [Terriglobales bacterium]